MAKMTDFDYEVRDRKRIARMASSKKNGSKSKKCSLPSDGMTRRQWEKKNGDVKVFNMNKPMNWDEFKAMSLELQKEYINGLIEKFGLTYAALGQMFGCIPTTVRMYFERNGINVSFKRGKKMTSEQNAEWVAFIGGDAPVNVEPVADAAISTSTSESAEESNENRVEEEPAKNLPKVVGTMLREFSLIFEGNIDPISIGNSIAAIVGKDTSGHIEVRCVTA